MATAAPSLPGGREEPLAVPALIDWWRWVRLHWIWLALLGLAAALRLAGIATTSLWHDEIVSIQVARMGVHDQIFRMVVADNQPPLYMLLLKLWAVVSWHPIWLRLLSVGLSLLGVVYAIRWGRLRDARCGWAAGLLVATSPLMVHYAQEIRTYALLYTCTLAGLYYGERFAQANERRWRVGLLISIALIGYAHYTGLMIVAMLLGYALLRGAGKWRLAVVAAAWLAMTAPIFVLGLQHSAQKLDVGYWIQPLDLERAAELLRTWTGHHALRIWETAGATVTRSWAAWGLGTALSLALVVAGILALVTADKLRQKIILALLAVSLLHIVLIFAFCLAVVPIALQRTTFPAFIPLILVLALSACGGNAKQQLLRGTLGWWACIVISTCWATTWITRVRSSVERRPAVECIFQPIAEQMMSGDAVVVFPATMQVSAGYMLGKSTRADQIHCAEVSRLGDSATGLRLLPIPRTADEAWFGDFVLAVQRLRQHHPDQHGIWVVDMGIRSAGDPNRQKVLDWLGSEYIRDQQVECGVHWTFHARRYTLRGREEQGPFR